MNRVQASQFVPSMFIAQEPQIALAARAAEGKRRVDLVLDPEERIENHRPAIVEIDFEGIEARVFAGIRIVAIDLERLDAHRAGRRRPRLPSLDARFRGHAEIPRHRKPLEQGGARNLIRGFDDHRSAFAVGCNHAPLRGCPPGQSRGVEAPAHRVSGSITLLARLGVQGDSHERREAETQRA